MSCQICGKPSGFYPLCNNCFKLRDEGKLDKCEECGKWTYKDKPCSCGYGKTVIKEAPKNESEPIEEQETKKCLLCNQESGNYLFCKDCFHKHHGKTLLFKITCDKNQKLELLNESYEGIYVCKDGHIVKSKSERDIDNYLFEHKIAHAYEKALPINGEIFKPDFYLKDLDVYIEHWGYDESNKEYTARKEYKIPKYREKGITLICTYESTDMQDVETSLQIKLESYKKGEINFL